VRAPMSSVIARPIGHQPAALRWKDLLLGPPLATSRLVRERLRKVVALAGVNVAVVHPTGP
jgi:hypothetical protein